MSFNPIARFGLGAIVLITTLLIAGCEPGTPQRTALTPRDDDPTTGVPDKYHFLYSGGIGYDEIDAVWKALPYTKIELERTECYGTCPSYIVSLYADGTAKYNGRKYAARTGSFDGDLEIWDYGQVCWMIDKFKILDGPRDYSANWSDSATTIIRVTLRESGDLIEISDYGGQGPIELWSLFNAVDAVSSRIEWKPTSVRRRPGSVLARPPSRWDNRFINDDQSQGERRTGAPARTGPRLRFGSRVFLSLVGDRENTNLR